MDISLETLVITGNFDKYMLPPMNLFFQVIYDRLQADAFRELIVGSILVGISVSNGLIVWKPSTIILFIISILLGALIFSSIKLGLLPQLGSKIAFRFYKQPIIYRI